MYTMKYSFINLLSVFAGRKFHKAYHSSTDTLGRKTMAWKNVYVGLRQMMPTAKCGRHVGNHLGSSCKPFLATQGIKPRGGEM